MSTTPFQGFSKETIKFFKELSNNNNREWFERHKKEYEGCVLTPAKDFVLSMGERLRALSPKVIADPRVNKSIFRIYRDIRFSKDKTPYKTNLALWFPLGVGSAKFDNPGYYLSLDSNSLMLGAGIHRFSKPLLQAYREAVVEPELGLALSDLITQAHQKGYSIGQKTYKRIPRVYDADHPLADLLRYSGLTFATEESIPDDLFSDQLVDYCFTFYRGMVPMITWLQNMKEKAGT